MWRGQYADGRWRPRLAPQDCLALTQVQGDYAAALSTQAWNRYADILKRDAPSYRSLFDKERRAAKRLRVSWLPDVLQELGDPEPEVAQAALLALGQWNAPGAADKIEPFLENDKAGLREAAAVALGKLGPAGRRVIERSLHDAKPLTRTLAVLAAAQSWDAQTKMLVGKALNDPDVRVRAAAQAAKPFL